MHPAGKITVSTLPPDREMRRLSPGMVSMTIRGVLFSLAKKHQRKPLSGARIRTAYRYFMLFQACHALPGG